MSVERCLTLLLVRHGETDWNAQSRWQGQRDVPLSAAGREQALRLGERLGERWRLHPEERPRLVTVSDLSRARETACLLLRAADASGLPMQETALLRERSFGSWEGLTRAEVQARFGDAIDPHDGEPWETVWERMRRARAQLWKEAPPGETTILAVGHGGSLRAWIADALGLDRAGVRRFTLGNASLSILTTQGTTLETATSRLLLLNDTSHWERE